MRSDSSGTSDLERMIGKAAVEAARMSSQASQAAKKILGDVTGEISETKSLDRAPLDLIDADVELIALVALPGASKDMIDLRVTEDSLYVDAKASPREGRYLRQELNSISLKREIKLPAEVKPEQVRAMFKDGILEVHLPKLVVVNAQKVQVD
ncbi:MAG TPA: Hsp20/alpha crystallin family protein [Methanothrix soehngenii]|jgi:HSP20 family protein|nr:MULTISPECIES: Hsp20/alpha crystallin family protein [Methanothrix]NYT09003.1 Hsp20/alpha crystallin family protein [Methanosarcinales archaeon]MBP7068448.1 Hsp20/alpha crystallin family protein [Methanothrix sp.]MCK9585680.1 Hsp20/alpha crystallin family protein [Methanothrix soehngenii]MDD3550950.1 Hsp20/alpha crystallin family protein [Methanothrix soehngenii]MDD3974432.1 Hsp20/alpha crystallin family protein [Methanothrix soehngenii]